MRTTKPITCLGCRRSRTENTAKFYSVPEDKYFCDQECHDAYFGLVRNAEGEVADMIKRYFREAGMK